MPQHLSESFWADETNRVIELLISIWMESGTAGANAVMDTLNAAGLPAVDPAIVFEALLNWIRLNVGSQAALIMAHTRDAVDEALALWDGEDLAQLEALIAPIFSGVRAETIALNEAVGGMSIGNLLAWQAYGIIEDVVWITREDEKVCPICKPRHEVVVTMEEALAGFHPPAHPRCRCRQEAILVLSRSLSLADALFDGKVTVAELEEIAHVQ